ncbi:MAG TPA: DNA primase [Candidatus Peribacteraceae bacterium]|nr:DNA primase [Candidatus Peribacteraceae bacterium]
MDAVSDIKARLPIEELVRQYTQLTKKGRNLVGLCPFHHDTKPSFLVSPDKGICYCFPCQKGGDIFTFYELIEGVDFKQALKDLAERTGVKLDDMPTDVIKKDEKERLRDCLTAAATFYAAQLKTSDATKKYLADRGVTASEIDAFQLGLAPDSFDATYQQLLKSGYSRKEIVGAGLGVQKDMRDEKIYDRFRNRLMFPIRDVQARIVGFGGRTLGNDDAKYLNTSDSPLYHKSAVLFGLDHALKSMRDRKRVVLVEGYFDVLACHRVGVTEAVATCGTALTEEHVRLLKRYVDVVVLCLDQDRAGRDAAERAFIVASKEGLQIEGVVLADKDPADSALTNPEELKTLLTSSRPYLAIVLDQIRAMDLSSPAIRRQALQRLLPLLQAIDSSTERMQAVHDSALALGTAETALMDDLQQFEKTATMQKVTVSDSTTVPASNLYTAAEVALGLFLLYPQNVTLLDALIPPEDGFALSLFAALKKNADAKASCEIDALDLDADTRAKAGVLLLYCEENAFDQWNESIAIREIRRNCRLANKEYIHRKQVEITKKLLEARKAGSTQDEQALSAQYLELLKLSKMAA